MPTGGFLAFGYETSSVSRPAAIYTRGRSSTFALVKIPLYWASTTRIWLFSQSVTKCARVPIFSILPVWR